MDETTPQQEFDPGGPTAGVFPSQPSEYRPRWWIHITLFLATFASTTMVGGLVWGGLPAEMARLSLVQLVTDPRVAFFSFIGKHPHLALDIPAWQGWRVAKDNFLP